MGNIITCLKDRLQASASTSVGLGTQRLIREASSTHKSGPAINVRHYWSLSLSKRRVNRSVTRREPLLSRLLHARADCSKNKGGPTFRRVTRGGYLAHRRRDGHRRLPDSRHRPPSHWLSWKRRADSQRGISFGCVPCNPEFAMLPAILPFRHCELAVVGKRARIIILKKIRFSVIFRTPLKK